jgi:hypothetical protein
LRNQPGPLHCGISIRPMSVQGQNENPPISGLCQLSPAADVPPHEAICERYQLQSLAGVIDHFVGEGVQFQRDVEPERLSGLEVDDELELSRLFDG